MNVFERPTAAESVAVVIVNYKTPDLALRCVETLRDERRSIPSLRAIVVDGGSGDGSAERIAAGLVQSGDDTWCSAIPLPINGGFGWANNQAMKRLLQSDDPPDYIHVLNPDAIVEPVGVSALVEFLEREPRAGAAGSLLLETDGRHAGSAFRQPGIASEFFRGISTPALERLFGMPSVVIESAQPVQADWITGASVMFRADALRKSGLFDEGFFLYFEEVELMHRLRKDGWEMWHVPQSRITHIGGASTGVDGGASNGRRRLPPYWFRSRRRMFARVRGKHAAFLASAAWIAGHLVQRIRALVGIPRPGAYADHELSDLVRVGLGATARDGTPFIGRWDDALDVPPAWMAGD